MSGVKDYAIYILSPEGLIRSWNAGAQRFKGYTAEEIIGQHFAVLRRAKIGSISFDMKLDPWLPPAIVDAAQFEAALLNLVVNARDAMPDGGTLTLSTEPVELRSNTIEGLPAGTLCENHRPGHRHGHAARGGQAGDRAFLHYEGSRQGYRHGVEPGLRHNQAIRRGYDH